jgi:hypothetical protein
MKMEFAGNMSLSIEIVPPKYSISIPQSMMATADNYINASLSWILVAIALRNPFQFLHGLFKNGMQSLYRILDYNSLNCCKEFSV